MTTIYYVPIEPLAERYTEQWYQYFPIAFKNAEFDVVVIDGIPLSDKVQVGTFLDINSTIHYKNSQLMNIASMFHEGKIVDGDIFFFGDIEFWGLESVRLLAQMNNKNIGIFGFLHAASYTKEDAFAVAANYQKYTELGWALACDGIFVGSNYHKQAFMERRVFPKAPEQAMHLDKIIHVTGNPIFSSSYKHFSPSKKKKMVITNRFDWEKRPNLSLDFAYLLKKRNPALEIAVTTSRAKFTSNRSWLVDYARNMEADGIIKIYEGLTKDQYHQHLAESRLMLTNSIEENFGYCVVEACWYNCAPLMPNSCSHPELVLNDSRYLFDSEDEIIPKAELLLNSYQETHALAKRYVDSPINNMIDVLKGFANGED